MAAALHGLKIAAAAVVAQALWAMARGLCPDAPRASLAVAAAAVTLLVPGVPAQLGTLALAAAAGLLLRPAHGAGTGRPLALAGSGLPWLLLFGLLLAALPLIGASGAAGRLAAAFVRTGALVFGGGHVVLPLLQAETVQPGWIGADTFLAGYGLAQAVPGPLFSFAAFLGAAATVGPGGVAGAALALAAIYAPSFLLVLGALPYWARLRASPRLQAALAGVNAAVVGLLAAAFYDPVWLSAVQAPADFALLLAAGLMLTLWRVPPWLVVPACAALAQLPRLA
jgi:chromate transporter